MIKMFKRMILLLIILFLLSGCSDDKPKEFEIVNLYLKSTSYSYGGFFLGIGGFSSGVNTHYYLYVKDNKGLIRFLKIRMDSCLLKFGKKPSIKLIRYYEYERSYSIGVSKCIITIPKGSIKRKYVVMNK